MNIIIGSSVGAGVLLIATITSCLFLSKGKKRYFEQGMKLEQSSSFSCLKKIIVGSMKFLLILL